MSFFGFSLVIIYGAVLASASLGCLGILKRYLTYPTRFVNSVFPSQKAAIVVTYLATAILFGTCVFCVSNLNRKYQIVLAGFIGLCGMLFFFKMLIGGYDIAWNGKRTYSSSETRRLLIAKMIILTSVYTPLVYVVILILVAKHS